MKKICIMLIAILAIAATALASPIGIIESSDVSAITVPEPATLAVLAFGGLALNLKRN